MKSDPPRRSDGRCAREGCSKPLTQITPRHKRYGGDTLLREPFCSVECCREYHNNSISGYVPGGIKR